MVREKKTSSVSTFKSIPLDKVRTGIDGLEDVLNGGYPEGRTTMIKGGPGSGKTLLATQFLVQNALRGTPGILVTFEESPEAIRTNAATLGWDLPSLEKKGKIFIYHARIDITAVTAGPFSLKGLIAIIDGQAKSMGTNRLVIDAIDILMRRFDDSFRARDELGSLHEWMDGEKITSLLTVKFSDDSPLTPNFGYLDYMADCVLHLDHRMTDQISTRRLRILKYRGSAFGSNEYPYVISENGISMIPIASAQLKHQPLGPHQSSGNEELDAALSGGYRRSSCVLITGASGTGKTNLACTFVHAACARGERVLYISYEESPEALESAVRGAGIDLRPAIRDGNLQLICKLPESMGSDEHLFHHHSVIKSFKPDHVVVDAMSACHRMGSGKAAFDYCMRLLNDCKERGITCFFTNQTQGSAGSEDLSGMGFSSLVDTVIQLRFEPDRDELRRSLVVLKARGSRHSARFHDLSITDHGIVVSPRKAWASGVPHVRSGSLPSTSGGAS